MSYSLRIKNEKDLLAIIKMPERAYPKFRHAFVDIGNDIQEKVFLKMVPYSGPNGGSRLQVRTGNLRQSFNTFPLGSTLPELRAVITAGGRTAPYARIQEIGGKITPSGSKQWLTIPLDGSRNSASALTQNGGLSQNSRLMRGGDGRWVTGKGERTRGVFGSSTGVILVERGGEWLPLYALVREVNIPPRLGILETIKDRQPYIKSRILEAMAKTVRGD